MVTLYLIINSANVTVTSNDLELIANQGATSYQWLDCLNGNTPISGATNNSLIPVSNGEYPVVVEENGCFDTSACVVITKVGLTHLDSQNWKLYPNPTSGKVTIEFKEIQSNTIVEVTNSIGQIISTRNIESSTFELQLGEARGVYFVRVISESGEGIIPVVKL